MSAHCKPLRVPLVELQPKFVQFTTVKGALRCMKTCEAVGDAQGIVFACPKCAGDKERAHFNIFLFDNAPEGARPLGRFQMYPNQAPTRQISNALFSEIGLVEKNNSHMMIRPRDVSCEWIGHLTRGEVVWTPGVFC